MENSLTQGDLLPQKPTLPTALRWGANPGKIWDLTRFL